jgi:hypothetical protein
VLWRSRIDLNDAKHHAKLADLDDFKGTADEVLLEKIEELRGIIDQNKGAFAKELGAALDLITERDRVISGMETEIDRLKGWLGKRENQLQELWGKKEPDTAEPQADDLAISLKFSNNVISERNSQIEELQISLKNHHEQFDNLKSHFEVTLKAIAMNLNALKGDRESIPTEFMTEFMRGIKRHGCHGLPRGEGWNVWYEPCPVIKTTAMEVIVISQNLPIDILQKRPDFKLGGTFHVNKAKLQRDGKALHTRYGEYFYISVPDSAIETLKDTVEAIS